MYGSFDGLSQVRSMNQEAVSSIKDSSRTLGKGINDRSVTLNLLRSKYDRNIKEDNSILSGMSVARAGIQAGISVLTSVKERLYEAKSLASEARGVPGGAQSAALNRSYQAIIKDISETMYDAKFNDNRLFVGDSSSNKVYVSDSRTVSTNMNIRERTGLYNSFASSEFTSIAQNGTLGNAAAGAMSVKIEGQISVTNVNAGANVTSGNGTIMNGSGAKLTINSGSMIVEANGQKSIFTKGQSFTFTLTNGEALTYSSGNSNNVDINFNDTVNGELLVNSGALVSGNIANANDVQITATQKTLDKSAISNSGISNAQDANEALELIEGLLDELDIVSSNIRSTESIITSGMNDIKNSISIMTEARSISDVDVMQELDNLKGSQSKAQISTALMQMNENVKATVIDALRRAAG